MAENDEIIIGDMKVAENVVNKIVRESAASAVGVSQVREVAVEPKDNGLVVNVTLAVGYKTIYPEVAADVQKAVTTDINRMTGVKVDEVNVTVERLDFGKE